MSFVNCESVLSLYRLGGGFDRPAPGWSSGIDTASGVVATGFPVRHRR